MTEAASPGTDPDLDLREELVDSRVLHRGKYLTFRIDRIRRADGSLATRDVCGHPGAVAILALDPDDMRRRRARNRAMLVVLLALCALFYAITIVKMTKS